MVANAFPAEIFHLNNGLRLVYHYFPTPIVVADIWIDAGAAIEPEAWSGMAHFLEHMIFKGTGQIQPGEFDYLVESQGGITNAATSHDYAHFYVTTLAEHLAPALSALAELLLHATIADDEFEKERHVIVEEIHQADDNPDWWGFQRLAESLYPEHPYGRSVLGTSETLGQLSPELMRQFHQRYYQPENITVVIVGGMEQNACIQLVEESFQRFPPRSTSELLIKSRVDPLASIHSAQTWTLPNLEQARLMMGWLGPGVKNSGNLKSACGLDTLAVVLAEGRSSRLVQELREKRQLVHGISADFSLQKDSSSFILTAWLDPEYLQVVEDLVLTRLQELHTLPIRPEELQRAKSLLMNDFTFSSETPGQRAGLYGYYSTIAQPELALTYPQHVASLSVEDLMQLATTYLSTENYALTLLISS